MKENECLEENEAEFISNRLKNNLGELEKCFADLTKARQEVDKAAQELDKIRIRGTCASSRV